MYTDHMNRTDFYAFLKAQGWTIRDLAKRWGMHPGSLYRKADNLTPRDIDALKGLPKRELREVEDD